MTTTDPTPNERDREVADRVASAANIVTHDGYFEIDISAVEAVIATYRAEIEAAAEQRGYERGRKDGYVDGATATLHLDGVQVFGSGEIDRGK